MGVVRLLCITIAFAFLATVAAQDCSGFGAIFNGRCVCLSGNAGANCETPNAGTCASAVHKPEQLKDNWFPNLVQSATGITNDPLIISFRNNTLHLAVNGELVEGRNYTDINFINNLNPTTPVNDTRCSLLGGANSFWSQSNQASDLPDGATAKYVYRCGDLFSLAMPWDQHQYCGFAANPWFEDPQNNALIHQYEAIIKMTYDDSFIVFDPENPNDDVFVHQAIKRHASVSYTIHVQFTKIVLVEVQNVVAFSNVTLTVVLTQFEYNPADSSATMTFASIVRWPHIIVRNNVTIEIPNRPELSFHADSGLPVAGNPYLISPETDQTIRLNPITDICSETLIDESHGPNCLERFTTKVYLGTGSCDFDGLYTFGGLVSTCRDDANYRTCPSEMQFVGLKLTNSGVCGAVTAEPQVTGELIAYSDAAMQNVATDFLVGSRAYVAVKVNTRNSFTLKWLDIFTISLDDVNMSDLNDRIPAVTDLTYSRPASAQYFVKDARLQFSGFTTNTHSGNTASFDPAIYPNGPIDLQGWNGTNALGGSLTDGAVASGPNFNFRWDGGIFTPALGTKKVYNIIAKAQLTFEGNEHENRKREVKIVDFIYKPDTSGMTASIICGLTESNEVAPANEAVTSSSINMVAVKAAVPVAGVALVVVAVAVIAAVVIVRRKKNTSTFRTLN